MKLFKAKHLVNLLNEKKYLPEEDNEGMTCGNVLSPSAKTTGGDISNSDSYAPGDNRIPKSLFKKPLKRKPEEDNEDVIDIPAGYFNSEKTEEIDKEADKSNLSYYQIALREYLKDQEENMSDEDIKKSFQSLKSNE